MLWSATIGVENNETSRPGGEGVGHDQRGVCEQMIFHHTNTHGSSTSSSMQNRDRLLLGLSGGKDSLAMLHTLVALQKRAPVR